MATFTAPGVRLNLDAPAPSAPPNSLLKTPGVVVSEDQGRWLNGVNLLAKPSDIPSLWEPCSEGTFRTKGDGTGTVISTFDPFVCYIPVTCSTFNWDILAQDAEDVLAATYSMGVESGLAQGVVGSVNPYFADINLTVLGGGAVSAPVALAYLENEIGGTGRAGMLHITPAVAAALHPFFRMGADGNLQTINGTPVVVGDGYIGVTPDGLGAPATGQDYIYATGPVQVRVGPLVMTTLTESLDRSDNTVTFRAERYVLATWDTVLQSAVLVDWTVCCGDVPVI